MNDSRTVIRLINLAHFLDHYAMLVFPAAVMTMAPMFGKGYAELLPYATPGFIAFGAGSLVTGWLGDHWSRRHMLAIFYFGVGTSLVMTGLAQNTSELGLTLLAVGLFASIYHPIGTAMLVAHARELGREVGINGVCGNLGVACAAFATGVLAQYCGWRAAFITPGLFSVASGLVFVRAVVDEKPVVFAGPAAEARVSPEAMRRVMIALVITIIASSTTFNAITIAIPKLFAERLQTWTQNAAWIGFIAAGVYVVGALAQYTIGHLLDRHALKSIFLPLAFLLAPSLVAAAQATGGILVTVTACVVIGIFGQVTINDAMVAKYTSDAWRARAFAARYFLGFTAAGASVATVAWLHDRGGFALVLHAFGALCVLVVVGAFIFPTDRPEPTNAVRRDVQHGRQHTFEGQTLVNAQDAAGRAPREAQ